MTWRRTELIALVLIVVFLGVLVAMSSRDDTGIVTESQPTTVVRSSYSTYPGGYKALYLTLGQLGYPVKRQLRPLALLPERGLLIIADPYKEAISAYEARRLRAWVSRGNYALVLVEHHQESVYAVGDLRQPALNPHAPAANKAANKKLAWWREQMVHASPGESAAAATAPSFLSDVAPAITVQSTIRFPQGEALPPAVLAKTDAAVPLYGDADGTTVLFTPLGTGGIFWSASPWMLSNDGIDKPGNVEFVLRLADLQPGAPVIFDEYHHGYGAGMTVWTLMPSLAKLGTAKLALAFVLLLFTLAWRFGAPRLPAEERFTRSRAEYLTSMSAVLERARATHVVRDRLLVLLRRELGRRLGVSPHAPLADFVEANRRRPVVEHTALERLARQLEAVTNQRRPAPETMLRLSRDVHALLGRR